MFFVSPFVFFFFFFLFLSYYWHHQMDSDVDFEVHKKIIVLFPLFSVWLYVFLFIYFCSDYMYGIFLLWISVCCKRWNVIDFLLYFFYEARKTGKEIEKVKTDEVGWDVGFVKKIWRKVRKVMKNWPKWCLHRRNTEKFQN